MYQQETTINLFFAATFRKDEVVIYGEKLHQSYHLEDEQDMVVRFPGEKIYQKSGYAR